MPPLPAERAMLLRAMDENLWAMERDGVRLARGELRETPAFTLVAYAHPSTFHNVLLVHAPVEPDEVVAAVRDFHGRRGVPFTIWTRAHADEELVAALRARGFRELVSLPAMVLQADPGTDCAPPGLAVRATTTDRDRRDFVAVTADAYAAYGEPPALLAAFFATLDSVCGPQGQGFVGYVAGRPVAAAWLYHSRNVAGISWVGTIPSARGRRYAEAVTWAAVREGFRRGAAFASLQASPMGRGVYARMGFAALSAYRLLVRAA